MPDAILLLSARVFPAAVFWQSGRTKVDGWRLNENALYVFQEEYRLPFVDPVVAAHAAAVAEHVFPLLLVLGLATRASALALLALTAVIQIFVYPDAWTMHGTWAALLLLLAARGAGAWSLDRLLFAPRTRR
jgi:putative oxidoreductase